MRNEETSERAVGIGISVEQHCLEKSAIIRKLEHSEKLSPDKVERLRKRLPVVEKKIDQLFAKLQV